MNLNVINIGQKELCSAIRSLVDFGKENNNCNADEVASSHEILPDDEGCECEPEPGTAAAHDLVKINERLENIASDITSNKEIIVILEGDLRGQASNVGENYENIKMLEKRMTDVENLINEISSNLNTEIRLIKAEYETREMDMKSYLDGVVGRSSDQNENIENIIGGLSSDIILNSEEINNLKKVVQSYKDENSGLSETINNLATANINRNLTPTHE